MLEGGCANAHNVLEPIYLRYSAEQIPHYVSRGWLPSDSIRRSRCRSGDSRPSNTKTTLNISSR